MSQAQLGRALSHGRYGVWYSSSYISKIEAGKVKITDEFERAVAELDVGTRHLTVLPSGVYATCRLPPGTVILGQVTTCGGCGGTFVFPWKTQRYCGRECRNAARRERDRQRRIDKLAAEGREP